MAPRRRGFTVVEILVALAIIATLAAILIPALGSNIGKSDTSRMATDLSSIQTAAQSFVGDVHRFPSSISELTTNIVANSSTDIDGGTIPSNLAPRWKGPYLSRTVITNTATGAISDAFTKVVGDNGGNYLTVTVTGISPTDFAGIEDLLDNGTTSSTSSTAGSIRYTGTTLTFLALPIQ